MLFPHFTMHTRVFAIKANAPVPALIFVTNKNVTPVVSDNSVRGHAIPVRRTF